VVAAGEQRFIIPVFAIREMVRVTPEMISTFRGQNEMALIRGQLLPIVRLYRRLGISSRSENLCDGMLVIAECEGKAFGIWIDDLLGRQELVIKSLGESLKDTPGVAGCAILGDGRVGLILDVASICKREQ
jgi:two-component system chemotaxis sensor kinase CheA